MLEQDECGTESLRVEEVREGDGRQVSAVSDEQGLVRVNELGLDFGHTVLCFGKKWKREKTATKLDV